MRLVGNPCPPSVSLFVCLKKKKKSFQIRKAIFDKPSTITANLQNGLVISILSLLQAGRTSLHQPPTNPLMAASLNFQKKRGKLHSGFSAPTREAEAVPFGWCRWG